MDRADVSRWVDRYEQVWRSAGTDSTDGVAALFTDDVCYLTSPWAEPIRGRSALGEFWEAEQGGPDETFSMTSRVLAVEGDTAVVRVEVEYGDGDRWRDLWVLGFDSTGRCRAFEEWPFAPRQADGHET